MEKRTSEILIKAGKEWYNAGGDMREIALQKFKEELVDKFPKTWEEFISTKILNWHERALYHDFRRCFKDKQTVEAYIALGKLIQLRDEYWRIDGDWKPTYLEDGFSLEVFKIYDKCCCSNDIVTVDIDSNIIRILTFRTQEILDEFYNNFKDLIEKAKMFL